MGLIAERTVGRLSVEVHDDIDSLARAGAAFAAAVMREAVSSRGVANVMFATGNSQLRFVDALVGSTADVPWDQTAVFHMDEYVGIRPDHSASFQHWIRERIADRARPFEAHYLDGLAEPIGECARYADLLRSHPLDLCCLGIGENGHLAFNDPPVADFADPLDVKVVELDSACRRQQVGEGHFPDVEAVPATAVTVTIPALLRSSWVLAVVPESRKSEAVSATLVGPVSTRCPASVLREQSNAKLLLDQESASLLGWT